MDTKSSYEKINYSLRPAKNIERKMLCEAFQKLALIQKVEKYRYVGFGSTYFSDFNLFHRLLGITDLISIEKDKINEDRFDFNKPFSCIDIEYGLSGEVLPGLTWGKLSIVWVDYDCKINKSILDDINSIIFRLKPGSVFIITVDVKPDITEDDASFNPTDLIKLRYKNLLERVGSTKTPPGIDGVNLTYEKNPEIIYKIIIDQIRDMISKRNGGLTNSKKINFEQIFHFLYDDGTLMLTLGGIVFGENQRDLIQKMQFEDLYFIRNNKEPFKIEVPMLTFKEISALNALLPKNINTNTGKIKPSKNKNMLIPKISADDVKKFSKIYRYFPTFAEANF